MLTAAINYMCDQNEPSDPFLLDLPVPAFPTLEELKQAVADAFKQANHSPEEDGGPIEVLVGPNAYVGHFAAHYKDSNSIWLFVSIDEELAKQLGVVSS